MFPLLTLSGTPHQRGVQHGAHFQKQVAHSIASYARLFAYFRGLDWHTMQAHASEYVSFLAHHAPHLLEEMRGIAQGAAQELHAIVALNVRTELLAGTLTAVRHPDYEAAMQRNTQRGVPQHAEVPDQTQPAPAKDISECTTIAAEPTATADGKTWLAQNWDWAGDQRAACVLLRIVEENKPTILTLTEAGIVGKIGLNSAGVGVNLNILASQLDGKKMGMPVHVLLRLVMETTTLEDAVELAKRVPSAASSCITVADGRGFVRSLEVMPNGVGELLPTNGVLVHTNHCVTHSALAVAKTVAATSTTVPRFNRAETRMNDDLGHISLTSLQAILRDKHNAPQCICRHPDLSLHPCDRTESVTGIVLDVRDGVMHIAPDVPDLVDFVAVNVESHS